MNCSARPAPTACAGKLAASLRCSARQRGTHRPLRELDSALTELADASGGKVVTAENAAELLDLIAHRTATRQVTLERPLRHSWTTLGLFLLFCSLRNGSCANGRACREFLLSDAGSLPRK